MPKNILTVCLASFVLATALNADEKPQAGANEGFVLHDATPIRLRLTRNLSSGEATVGETVDFEVLDDVKVSDALVVARGGTAIATVTNERTPPRSPG